MTTSATARSFYHERVRRRRPWAEEGTACTPLVALATSDVREPQGSPATKARSHAPPALRWYMYNFTAQLYTRTPTGFGVRPIGRRVLWALGGT